MKERIIPEYCVNITRLLPAGESVELSIDEDALAYIAPEIGVETVSRLAVTLNMKPWRKNGCIITGKFNGEVKQTCVATLEPMLNKLKGEFERYFLLENDMQRPEPDIIDGEMILNPDQDDFPDLISGEKINLWEIVVEELNLQIDLFPRSIEATPGLEESKTQETIQQTHTPFSDLKTLITEKKS